jgi:hypothetical protein
VPISIKETALQIELKERISNKYEDMIGADMTEANNHESALLARKRNKDPVIDSRAMLSCTPFIEQYEVLDQQYCGSLGTTGKSTLIAGKGVILVCLSSGKVMRLRNILYMPSLKQILLSMQALYADGIWNWHDGKGYSFYRDNRKVIAKGYNIGRTSYLGWVNKTDALMV